MDFVIGVILSLLAGTITNFGFLFQKKGVNSIPLDQRGKGYIRRLVKKPVWVTGIVFQFALGGALTFFAVKYIGPSIYPGLAAVGLIVLALGSVRLNQESLNKLEIAGIFILIGGIALVGSSGLQIEQETALAAVSDGATLVRIAVFTVLAMVVWGGLHFASYKVGKYRATVMAFSNGIAAGMIFFWLSPLTATMSVVFAGDGDATQIIMMVVSGIALAIFGILGPWQLQIAFKYGQASNVVPVVGITQQTIPVIVYFVVYALALPSPMSVYNISIGVFLIVISGFLLGRRQAESMDKPAEAVAASDTATLR